MGEYRKIDYTQVALPEELLTSDRLSLLHAAPVVQIPHQVHAQ